MKFFEHIAFIFHSKPNKEFSSLTQMAVSSDKINDFQNILRTMPVDDLHAFKVYTRDFNSVGAEMWIEAELQRREFILKQSSLYISIIAIIISSIALIK